MQLIGVKINSKFSYKLPFSSILETCLLILVLLVKLLKLKVEFITESTSCNIFKNFSIFFLLCKPSLYIFKLFKNCGVLAKAVVPIFSFCENSTKELTSP